MKNWKNWLGAMVLLVGWSGAWADEPAAQDTPPAEAAVTNNVEEIESTDGHSAVTVSSGRAGAGTVNHQSFPSGAITRCVPTKPPKWWS
jgi:hypothetical protein